MKMLSIEEARDQLAKLVEEAQRGEEIVLTENGTAVARLVPHAAAADGRRAAADALRRRMREGFDLGGRDWSREDLHGHR
ncbi:type II toxin-antitoxin system Phd/YefM family antitoxin [Azospirillum isscasi]|uniref:Antitoxin n=1 Tax=Azospirillum isscasi TaxID=3053926 RepID=A0ABU0WGA9_9PROT|nr:type II toxin-antitoxin system prevent-host-death family antitoxin [Azospirillum isscasi]MDQ2102664.1 type II toxin-antitoxin system prevent-host-death family antitoxin [Azospirillum isscasi]